MKLPIVPGSAIIVILFGLLSKAHGGKLLVVPMDGSHWLSMRPVVERLTQNGHQVVVLMPESSLTISGSNLYTVKTFSIPYTNKEVNEYLQNLGKDQFTLPLYFPWVAIEMLNSMMRVFKMFYTVCESLLLNQELIQSLRDEKYDAVLTDPFLLCGVILAEHLELPNVNFLRGLPCAYDYISSQCESPLSYVPRLFTKNSDKMTFMQRVENMIVRTLEPYYCGVSYLAWLQLGSKILKKEVTAVQLLSRTSLWLLRYDFVFDYPRPIMPNMVFVGGINCDFKKSLQKVRSI